MQPAGDLPLKKNAGFGNIRYSFILIYNIYVCSKTYCITHNDTESKWTRAALLEGRSVFFEQFLKRTN